MSSLDCKIWHCSISLATKLQLYTESSSFMSFSMQQKHGHPLDNYWETLMHLISGVCIAYYKFPGGTAFQMRGPQTCWLATTDTHHPYHTSQVLQPYLTCWSINWPQPSALVQCGPLPRDWNHRSGLPCQTWLCTVESDVAAFYTVLKLPIIEHRTDRHGGCSWKRLHPLDRPRYDDHQSVSELWMKVSVMWMTDVHIWFQYKVSWFQNSGFG